VENKTIKFEIRIVV